MIIALNTWEEDWIYLMTLQLPSPQLTCHSQLSFLSQERIHNLSAFQANLRSTLGEVFKKQCTLYSGILICINFLLYENLSTVMVRCIFPLYYQHQPDLVGLHLNFKLYNESKCTDCRTIIIRDIYSKLQISTVCRNHLDVMFISGSLQYPNN